MSHPRNLSIAIVVSIAALLSGCGPEKARALRTAAVQFRIEALAAVEAIDDMHRRELAPPSRSSAQKTEEFVGSLLRLDPGTALDEKTLERLIEPDIVRIDPAVAARWNGLLDGLRQQYSAFSAIFDDVERGSYLAMDAVRRAGKHAEVLTVQMAGLAGSIQAHPAVLLQQRSTVLARLESARRLAGEAERRLRFAELQEEWENVRRAERELTQATVERCLKAAILGRGVKGLVDTYEQLSLDDVNGIIAGLLDTAGSISGQDFTGLKRKTNGLVNEMKADRAWSVLFTRAEAEVRAAVQARR